MNPQLGSTVTDRITGFTGTLTGICTYISGCSQGLVVPKVDSEGKLRDGQWFDIQRLAVDFATPIVTLDNSATPGPDATPTRRY